MYSPPPPPSPPQAPHSPTFFFFFCFFIEERLPYRIWRFNLKYPDGIRDLVWETKRRRNEGGRKTEKKKRRRRNSIRGWNKKEKGKSSKEKEKKKKQEKSIARTIHACITDFVVLLFSLVIHIYIYILRKMLQVSFSRCQFEKKEMLLVSRRIYLRWLILNTIEKLRRNDKLR